MDKKHNLDTSKILNLSNDIAERNARDANSLVFLAKPFVQTTLPHRDPGDVPVWFRRNGNLTLSLKPGWNEFGSLGKPESIGLPYGTAPRLILLWMTTQALKTGNSILELGSSLAEFMRALGLDSTQGGKRSPLNNLKNQIMRLFRSTISIDDNSHPSRKRWIDMQVVQRGNMSWINMDDPRFNSELPTGQNFELFGSWIELTPLFFQSVTDSAVPLDMRIIQEIKQSPLALDLYAWMTHRTYGLDSINSSPLKPSKVEWKLLHEQFGSNYNDIKDFKKKLKPHLRLLQSLSNNLFIEETSGGLNISRKMTRVK